MDDTKPQAKYVTRVLFEKKKYLTSGPNSPINRIEQPFHQFLRHLLQRDPRAASFLDHLRGGRGERAGLGPHIRQLPDVHGVGEHTRERPRARSTTPAATPSSVEFQPQCVRNAPTAPCRRISICGAQPRTTRPRPAVLSSSPSGCTATSAPTAQTNRAPLASSAAPNAAA
uniref:Uncharacterized protein n=1 Tax=Oryza punctata TaxID=4537 RepID=A0A0E0LW84_ORYPU